MGLARKPRANYFKGVDSEGRVYPNYFAPVMIWQNNQREFTSMRYRVRPRGSDKEIPSKYNVFNARLDMLGKRRTWKAIFGKNHGIFAFTQFYEWVEDKQGKKKLITFSPTARELMWAPCIFDRWQSADGKVAFSSFALLTDEPPPEIAAQGHDRCPIFLAESALDNWLQPEKFTPEQLYELLQTREAVVYEHAWAA